MKMLNKFIINHLKCVFGIISAFLVLSVLVVSCVKKPSIDGFEIEIRQIEVGTSSVTISGAYFYPGTATINSIMAEIDRRSDFINAEAYDVNLEGNDFQFTVSGLEHNTMYYYRFVVDYGGETEYFTEYDDFTTVDSGLPTVKTLEVSYVGPNKAVCGGVVEGDGGHAVTARGVCYGKSHNPSVDGMHTIDSCGIGSFESELNDLQLNTFYYYRAYATNEMGTTYGEELQFMTSIQAPKVRTLEIIADGDDAMIVKAEVVSDGSKEVVERGVCWSTSGEPTLDDEYIINGSGIGYYTCRIDHLQPNTTYYVRAFARNEVGLGFGFMLNFTTGTPVVKPTVNTVEVTDVMALSAKCLANVSDNGGAEVTDRGVCWSRTSTPSLSDHHASSGTGLGSYSVDMTSLSPNTLYYVRAYATNSKGTAYGEVLSFTTADGLPVVNTASVSNITGTTATGGGEVSDQGASAVTQRGVCWSESHNPTLDGSHASSGSGLGVFSAQITGLTPNHTYYVRAYAVNTQGVAYGNEVEFEAKEGLPEVITAEIENITANSATGGGNVVDQGASAVTQRGICWSTEPHPTIDGSHASSGSGAGSFTVEMSGLSAGTTYYVRAYAVNAQGVAYGEEQDFVTLANKPEVVTAPVSNVTQNTAMGGGEVTSSGGATVTERGVCWSTSHSPTLNDSHVASGAGLGDFTVQMTGLQSGTLYHVRAYATNSQGTSYGQEMSFTTLSDPPTVVTTQVSNIGQNAALGGGVVTSDGGSVVTERGICWGTTHNPTIDDSHANNGTGTGAYTVEMTGLTPNQTYYVRAYAINSAGIAYGTEVNFTTAQGVSAPTVLTLQVTNVTQTMATAMGEVTNSGGALVTERGICWSTSPVPTVNGNHANNGTGDGTFTVQMLGLLAHTTYYVRAYAINSAGISYGNELVFVTAAELPTVTTSSVTNITQTTAQGGGNVLNSGGATVTERGICWSTNPIPTTNNSHASGGAGMGVFSVNMTGLTPNTTYYIRAYAVNSTGTAYGEEVSFVTAENFTAPLVTTSNVTNVTETTAMGGGNVTADGGTAVTERGICWSTEPNPSTEGPHESNGTGTGSFTVEMTNLNPHTTYYVRAYAINNVGTSYGDEVSFTTTSYLFAPTVATLPVIDIAQTTAKGCGNVTDDGGATVTERGVCWSTSNNPTVAGSHASSGTGTGAFSVNMTGLTANTTYYVRAYAINSQGTSYGEEVSFTTLQNYTIPSVITAAVDNVTNNTALCGGTVMDDGGIAVTERGVCWSTSSNPTIEGAYLSGGSGLGSYTVSLTDLSANTTYYVRAYAVNLAGVAYGDEVIFSTLSVSFPTGAINGVFSVSPTQQVYFSQGNLQYKASTDQWRFATNQYDIVGLDNMNISSSYNDWIDLFAWGTSGYNHGALFYEPWSIANTDTLYNAYGDPLKDLGDETGQADWGYNAIENGGNQTNQWRTLTVEEWTYLLETRNTTSGIRYAKAILNNVKGMVVLPDDWDASFHTLYSVNMTSSSYSSNVISLSDWSVMEAHGAVFLPAAGSRFGTMVFGFSQPNNASPYGYYWSSSHYVEGEFVGSYFMKLNSFSVSPSYIQTRYLGQSVRVVRPVEH